MMPSPPLAIPALPCLLARPFARPFTSSTTTPVAPDSGHPQPVPDGTHPRIWGESTARPQGTRAEGASP